MKNQRDHCSACGKKWIDHPGVQPTCAALQTAVAVLRQISILPRRRRARDLATATLLFLETQTPGILKRRP